jgi:hypothetical protein
MIRWLLEHEAKINAKDREAGGTGDAWRFITRPRAAIRRKRKGVPTPAARQTPAPAWINGIVCGPGWRPRRGRRPAFARRQAGCREQHGASPCGRAAGGHAEVVKLLLEAGANPNPKGQSPLEAAATSGHAAVVKMLLHAGAKQGPKAIPVQASEQAASRLQRFCLSPAPTLMRRTRNGSRR